MPVMDLLPKTKAEFGKKEYWNKFFQKRGKDSFEWYGEYPQLCSILHKYIKPNNNILGIGCGNSRLCVDLYDVGSYHNNINIDISENAIKSMNKQHTQNRPGLEFLCMDMLQMSFENEKFHVVLDKGTLDAIMSDSSAMDTKTSAMFSEIDRVIKYGGRYICISLLQEHIIQKLLSWFPSRGWMIRIHRCFEAEQQVESSSVTLPVFVVIVTKMKPIPGAPPILELCLDHNESIRRVARPEEVTENLSALQHYAFVQQKLSKKSTLDDQICVELHSANNDIPRYKLYIVDLNAKASKLKFAIFVVPQGRDCEWLFSNESGQRKLNEKICCQRLVIVHLSRDHNYEDIESIKLELSPKVVELKPPGLPANYQIPFLSISDGIGERNVCHRGNSASIGEYIIEEIFADNFYFRRLIFLSAQNIIQSEARLKSVSKSKRRGKCQVQKKVVDLNYLACTHHKLMICGLSFLAPPQQSVSKEDTIRVLIVGLGGGSLPMFLHNFPFVCLDIVEIDNSMVDIAKTWFNFVEDSRSIVHVDDGLKFITSESKLQHKYDIVMFDVDSKDTDVGLSCPPKEFVEPEFLKHSLNILNNKGLLIINFVCRDKSIENKTVKDLKNIFGTIFMKKVHAAVNKIIYCLNENVENPAEKLEEFKQSLLLLNKRARCFLHNEDLVNVTEILENINLI